MSTASRLETTLDHAITPASLHPVLARQAAARYIAQRPIGLKINLYTAAEVEAVAVMLDGDLACAPVECLMVGDSYFTTHLGRASTQLNTPQERAWGLSVLISRIAEVSERLNALFPLARRPYLMADLPDGTLENSAVALSASRRLLDAGADVVKMEVACARTLVIVEGVAEAGVPVIAHLGYTPQRGELRRHGDDLPAALRIFAAARRARDAGACALVLEMVSETVNRALALPDRSSLPVYSVFSGAAPYCAQSLNIWDSVFRPSPPRKFFPPTATLDPMRDRARYTADVVAAHLTQLVRQTLGGVFPLSPPTRLTAEEQSRLMGSRPWREERCHGFDH